MARAQITIDGEVWTVYPSGRVTVYTRDEFALVFERGTGPHRERRVARYSPLGTRHRDAAFAELSARELEAYYRQSQPAWTAPEVEYGGR